MAECGEVCTQPTAFSVSNALLQGLLPVKSIDNFRKGEAQDSCELFGRSVELLPYFLYQIASGMFGKFHHAQRFISFFQYFFNPYFKMFTFVIK